jgi:hypothetical protein
MQHLDNDYVEELVERLYAIPGDAVPKWGKLRKDALIRHLIWALRHSMGRSQKVPYVGNWFTEKVVGPVIIHGWVPMPHNIQLPRHLRDSGVVPEEPGDLETFHAMLEEYLNLVQADELTPARHPAFGEIGVDGWDRVHVLHFEHHLKQFDA